MNCNPNPQLDSSKPHEFWINKAIEQALYAKELNEVPIGAVIVKDDESIATGFNSPIRDSDPCSHAEIVAIRRAAKILGNYRLPDTTLYVTLEPCIMCMGAIIQARIPHVIFGAYDLKTGAAGSIYSIGSDNKLNHPIEITGGILASSCGKLLKDFFKERRSAKRT